MIRYRGNRRRRALTMTEMHLGPRIDQCEGGTEMLTSDERMRLTQIEEQAHIGYGAIGGLRDALSW